MGEFLLKNLGLMVYLLSFVFLGGLVIHLIEGACEKRILRAFGYTGIVITGLGVVVHELSHYIFAKLGGMHINEVSLFRPVKGRLDGRLGYVNYSYNKRNMKHILFLLFTGIAPIIGGALFILGTLFVIQPEIFNSILDMGKELIASQGGVTVQAVGSQLENVALLIREMFSFSNLSDPLYLMGLFLMFSVASHMSLSGADIKGAIKGIPAVYLLISLISMILGLFGVGYESVLGYIGIANNYIVTFMLIAIMFSLVNFIIIYVVSAVFMMVKGKKVVL